MEGCHQIGLHIVGRNRQRRVCQGELPAFEEIQGACVALGPVCPVVEMKIGCAGVELGQMCARAGYIAPPDGDGQGGEGDHIAQDIVPVGANRLDQSLRFGRGLLWRTQEPGGAGMEDTQGDAGIHAVAGYIDAFTDPGVRHGHDLAHDRHSQLMLTHEMMGLRTHARGHDLDNGLMPTLHRQVSHLPGVELLFRPIAVTEGE